MVGVADCDSITPARQQHRIRIGGIDAPEKTGTARRLIPNFAFSKEANANCYKVDRYRLDVCTVYVDGKDVGLAWWYRKYAREQHPRDRVTNESVEDRSCLKSTRADKLFNISCEQVDLDIDLRAFAQPTQVRHLQRVRDKVYLEALTLYSIHG